MNLKNNLKIKKEKIQSFGIKFSIVNKERKILGRAFLYIMKNDLHQQPFGLLEDVFIEKEARQQGLGSSLIKEVIKTAQRQKCYKLIATSRYSRAKVHSLYSKLEFSDYGKEFRINF